MSHPGRVRGLFSIVRWDFYHHSEISQITSGLTVFFRAGVSHGVVFSDFELTRELEFDCIDVSLLGTFVPLLRTREIIEVRANNKFRIRILVVR